MSVIATILAKATASGKRFVLIGGHAVNLHGLSRQTADLDLIIDPADTEWWCTALLSHGYQQYHRTPAFIQFSPLIKGSWPVDLSLVHGETFEKLYETSEQKDFDGNTVQVASALHIVAMKLHALKSRNPEGALKDMSDILGLLRILDVAVSSPIFRNLALKYGSEEIYRRISDAAKS
jgi:hypothetical protein